MVQDILDIINSLNLAYLSIVEMMFFVTYLGKEWNGKLLNKEKIIEFIEEFRSLKSRAKIVEIVISEYCNPKNFKGDKTSKRDFHNWKNEAQSMFNSLNLMSLFEYDEKNHHIVPFYYAKDIDALKAIDDWQNLIYIDSNSHRIFTLDKKAKHAIRLTFKDLDAALDNLIGDEIILKYTTQIRYKKELQTRLINYNKALLGLK